LPRIILIRCGIYDSDEKTVFHEPIYVAKKL